MKNRIILLFMCLFAWAAVPAHAAVYTFADGSTYWPGWQNGTCDDFKDAIGVPDFTSGSVTTENGNTLTAFSLSYTASSTYNTLSTGDLFINVDDDQTWDYVVDLSGRSGGTYSVYAFNEDYSDTDSYVMSTGGSGIREDHPTGALVYGDPVATVMWTGLEDWTPASGALSTTISGLDIEYDVLTVAYTVSCANDVVFVSGISQTPIPAAAWLLGSGLLGLVGLRHRKRSA